MSTPELDLMDSLASAQAFVTTGLENDMHVKINPAFHEFFRHTLLDPAAKRLRPALALMTTQALGSSWDESRELAIGVEEFHAVSLVLDDMPDQDNSETRRDRPAAHIEFGETEARLSAQEILNQAYRSVMEADARHDLRGGISIYATKLISKLIEGQLHDLDTFGAVTTIDDLDAIARGKTGVLVEMSIVGAGLIAGASNDTIDHLRAYSQEFGVALQVNNDLLDRAERGDDERNCRPSYVSVMDSVDSVQGKLQHHVDQAIVEIEPLSVQVNTQPFEQAISFVANQAVHVV